MNVLDPNDIFMSAEAYEIFLRFHDEIELELGVDGIYAGIRAFANKVPEHSARIAATLTLAENLEAKSIPVEKMEAGITLARYYLNESLRLHTTALINQDMLLADKLLTWAQKRGQFFSISDVYQKGPTSIRRKETAQRIISILIERNQIRHVSGGMKIAEKQRQTVFEII